MDDGAPQLGLRKTPLVGHGGGGDCPQPSEVGRIAVSCPGRGIGRPRSPLREARKSRSGSAPIKVWGAGDDEGPLYFFFNSSTEWNKSTEPPDPEASEGYFVSEVNGWINGTASAVPPCGFSKPASVAYDDFSQESPRNYSIDADSGNVVRRVTFSRSGFGAGGEDPFFDRPGSDSAVGKVNLDSGAIMMHPRGDLTSFSGELNRLEVLTPLKVAVSDESAPLSPSRAPLGI